MPSRLTSVALIGPISIASWSTAPRPRLLPRQSRLDETVYARVTAPAEAELTVAAYFDITPVPNGEGGDS